MTKEEKEVLYEVLSKAYKEYEAARDKVNSEKGLKLEDKVQKFEFFNAKAKTARKLAEAIATETPQG